ncbi:hypothetical protein RhiJN_01017 [Ceratobasidium sp. AG-Ba]|nr:hypothetical protein RhiJN_01017 [Ceratobasidium sp. AG-Ba]QRW02049.1 hypothetical protein RhiLY_01046 [Ceratobasidium sp. AG-Ba]
MTPLYYNSTHLNPLTLPKLAHLVVPSLWLVGLPGSNAGIFSQFPSDITALYIRGRVGTEEANQLVARCTDLRYATVRVFASVSSTDLVKFTRVLVSELKQLLSLELMLASEQDACLSSRLREEESGKPGSLGWEKVSVHVVDDDSEMDMWMNESRSTRPSWAQ